MTSNISLNSLLLFLFLMCQVPLSGQTNIAPVNIEIKVPRIKATDMNNNLDIFMYAKLNEFFVDHQHIFNVIDRTEMSKIDEERSIHKSKNNTNLSSGTMLGTQIILESTLKNFKEKIDSACVVKTIDKGSVGKVKLVDTKITNCSLYILTYTFDIELSAIDVETGSVIETITLNIGSEGKASYNNGSKDMNALKKDCIHNLNPCFNKILKESVLFVTRVNIPIVGNYESNEKKLETDKLLILGANKPLIPYQLKMDVMVIEEEKIGDETVERRKIIGSGKIVNSIGELFVLDIIDGKKEIYSSLERNENIFSQVGKNMLTKTCLNPLVKTR